MVKRWFVKPNNSVRSRGNTQSKGVIYEICLESHERSLKLYDNIEVLGGVA